MKHHTIVGRTAAALLAVALGLGLMATPASANVAGFSDIKGGEYYAAAVAWMRGAGLTTGVGGTNQYQPNGIVTRGQMVTFLWRLEGEPTGYPDDGFVDVATGAYYEKAVRWAKATKLTTGVGGTNRFAPNDPVTRAQMAAFLYRFEDPVGTWPHHGFIDVPTGSYYDVPVRWLKAKGITTGVSANRYAPHDPVTRGQMAAFIWRMEGKPAPPNPGDTKNCSNFATQNDAQQWFNLYYPYYGDIAKLDQDNNMVPCESLP